MPSPDPNPAHLFPLFEPKVLDIVAELSRWCSVHWSGNSAMLFEGLRSQARQIAFWQQGRDAHGNIIDKSKIVTYKNGTTNPSNHQSCLAADIVGVTPNGNPTWDCPQAFWSYLQHLAHVQGLTSGSDWTMEDEPHIEWPAHDEATYAKARQWKAAQGLK